MRWRPPEEEEEEGAAAAVCSNARAPSEADCPLLGCAARVVEYAAGRRTLTSSLTAAWFAVLGAGEELVDEAPAVVIFSCGPDDEIGPDAGPDLAQAWYALRTEVATERNGSGQRWWHLCRTRRRHPRPDARLEDGPDPAQALRLPRRRRGDSP